MQDLRGRKFTDDFDPQLIANFDEIFNNTFHKVWNPAFKTDLGLTKDFDFFKIVVSRVKKYNESSDLTVVGDRGLGKSAFAVSAATIMHRYFFNAPDALFPMENVCFDVESWIERTNSMRGKGGVVILDEVGTEGSLSSRTSMSRGNRTTSDIIQLMRTDRIITIYISVDRDRIDKRVRQLSSLMGTPIAKLDNEATGGYGLAIAADVKYRRTMPASAHYRNKHSESDSGYLQHVVSPVLYSPKGQIISIIVPHPEIDIWQAYETKRDLKLEEVREHGLLSQKVDLP